MAIMEADIGKAVLLDMSVNPYVIPKRDPIQDGLSTPVYETNLLSCCPK